MDTVNRVFYQSTRGERRQLKRQVFGNFYMRPPMLAIMRFLILLPFGIVPLAIGIFMAHHRWLFIDTASMLINLAVLAVGGLLFFVFVIYPFLERKERAVIYERTLENLNKHHGGIEKVLSEIKSLIDEDVPSHSISEGYNLFHVIGDWFLHPHYKQIVHISQIAAIVGIMNSGTFIVLDYDEKDTCGVLFGEHSWGEVFQIFVDRNPNILYSTDIITLDNGDTIEVREAVKKNNLKPIIDSYKAVVSEQGNISIPTEIL